MSNSFNYSLTTNDSGNPVIRSTVSAYNLNTVTDKDVVSFYETFSSYSHFDTGLMPVDGTGVLAIRSAGPHTQITIQHKPGLYYINWGAHEGARDAATYLLAQPYRLVIGDFNEGNLLGARTFYSPFPFNHPDIPLYHVNLPNINCRGYRNNGVGWICLYHNEDVSHLPLGEKIAFLIQRCSGVETYNDANMSETDGPRFYKDHYTSNPTFAHLWDPTLWQEKSLADGFEWTLNEELWIPVKVNSMDDQAAHNPNGVPLTLGMAMIGNYRAYYTDSEVPKDYNLFARPDLSISPVKISSYFKKSFASAKVTYSYDPLKDPINSVSTIRENKSLVVQQQLKFNQDEEDNSALCTACENTFNTENDHYAIIYDNIVCGSCLDDSYVYIDSADNYYHVDDSDIVYDNDTSTYYHIIHDTVIVCPHCDHSHCYSGKPFLKNNPNETYPLKTIPTSAVPLLTTHVQEVCIECVQSFLNDLKKIHDHIVDNDPSHSDYDKIKEFNSNIDNYDIKYCLCGKTHYNESFIKYDIEKNVTLFKNLVPYFHYNPDDSYVTRYKVNTIALCKFCSVPPASKEHEHTLSVLETNTLCPCGMRMPKDSIEKCSTGLITVDKDGSNCYEIFNACSSCIVNRDPTDPSKVGEFKPVDEDRFEFSLKNGVFQTSPCVYAQQENLVEADYQPF